MAIIQVSIVPVGIGTSISEYVARAVKVLQDERGMTYRLTPMGTIIEGDLDRALGVLRKMHESVFSNEVRRVLTTIIIDDRRDKRATMASKVRSVRRKL